MMEEKSLCGKGKNGPEPAPRKGGKRDGDRILPMRVNKRICNFEEAMTNVQIVVF